MSQAHPIRHLHHGPAAEAALDSDYYDQVYSVSARYRGPPEKSGHYRLWMDVAQRVNPESRVLEVGCGTGQLAEMLHAKGLVAYRGFDFSDVAVELARSRVPTFRFDKLDARDQDAYAGYDYDLALTVEVLEHLDDDLSVLRGLPSGMKVIFTVPNFSSASHVRFFRRVEAVHAYYGPVFSRLEVDVFKTWFIGSGTVL